MSDVSRPSQHLAIITSQADRCVKCGLCLPHCPTYAITRNEAESPRGRITLAEAMARGTLTADTGLVAHLDSCLLCRRCESACPSKVHFGDLMDHARALTLRGRPRWLRIAASLLSHRRLVSLGLKASRLWPDAWMPGGAGLTRAALELSERKITPQRHNAADEGPRVGLFLGCVGGAVQGSALQAARQLLSAAGATVVIPHAQVCCGAMHGHLGDAARATDLAARNHAAFAAAGVDVIVSLASGCGTQLAEQNPALSAPHHDVSQYLLSSGLIDHLTFAPLPSSVLLHTPCSLALNADAAKAVRTLLDRIPQLSITPLDAGPSCCGAAGLQLLSHPEQGAALRAPKLTAIAMSEADLLITSNPGCALHLLAGIGDSTPEVLHPAELLARQLIVAPGGAEVGHDA